MTAKDILEKLKSGNQLYLGAKMNQGDISISIRRKTYEEGQSPYAVVITCSDSRVIPEAIFSTGIGELFVIRVAGNVIMESQLASIEYAVEHLGCQVVVVLGHERCGAIEAVLSGDADGHVCYLADQIRQAIGDVRDEKEACLLNVEKGVKKIKDVLGDRLPQMCVTGAYYRIRDGKVVFGY